jgi:hypothetical protein
MARLHITGGEPVSYYNLEDEIDARGEHALESRVRKLESRIRVLEDAAKAYRDLCTCYRIGKQPTEKLFNEIDKARAALEVNRD